MQYKSRLLNYHQNDVSHARLGSRGKIPTGHAMGPDQFVVGLGQGKVSDEYSFSQMINLISKLNNPQTKPIYLIGHCLAKSSSHLHWAKDIYLTIVHLRCILVHPSVQMAQMSWVLVSKLDEAICLEEDKKFLFMKMTIRKEGQREEHNTSLHFEAQ